MYYTVLLDNGQPLFELFLLYFNNTFLSQKPQNIPKKVKPNTRENAGLREAGDKMAVKSPITSNGPKGIKTVCVELIYQMLRRFVNSISAS